MAVLPSSKVAPAPTHGGSSAAGGARVILRDLRKQYGAVPALAGVSLDVAPGEFLTLLGPSGSGKTTTLLLLAGFEQPTAGEIVVAGKPMAAVPPHRRDIGMVFQHYALFPHMSVGENIAFPLKQRGVASAEIARRTRAVLDLVNLSGVERRFPRQLSGGQQQRIALARALVFDPRVLLMDEPLGALDKQLRERLQGELKALHARLGTTIVHVTHDQQEALALADRIAVMRGGQIEQIGRPDDLYENPATPFVASFVGESNMLTGTVAEIAADRCRVALGEAGTIWSCRSGNLATGERVTVAIRPEKLAFADTNLRTRGNLLQGSVAAVAFAGDMLRFEVLLPGGQRIQVKQQNRSGLPRPAQGGAISVAWDIEDTRIFAQEGE